MKLVALVIVGLMASVAFAGLDPATDSFGVYFDTAGNTSCTTAEASDLVTAHLLLMNPAGPTSGFECSIAMTGAAHFALSTLFGGGFGFENFDETPGGFVVAGPRDYVVPSTGAVVLVTWTFLILETSELLFRIGPGSIPSLPGGLPVVTGDGVLRLCGVASGDVNLPVAGINAVMCPVSEEARSFGEVKSLFR